MPIKHWPKTRRPREKLIHYGAPSLSDSELLALFLGSGRQGSSALDLANDLLDEFGSLSRLFMADKTTLCAQTGIGHARYALLQAAQELCRRQLAEEVLNESVFNSPGSVRRYLSAQLATRQHEVFVALFLDNRHRVLAYRELFRGTIDSASVYPREVVKQCLADNAAAVIFAHNHPSGVAEPSDTDVRLTHRLVEALALIDVRVLDHFVIGQGQFTSLAERGML